ncbi:MAG: hypothetical protein HBSAPP03_06600 [Phycisphaerae bacterium]|nr:MAG: hypothetical protein HBSAPP03_06600 [Phycisphaerae bacterium]
MSSFADLALRDFLAATAAKSPAPGGGAVAAVIGAHAAALARMVVSYSLGKKNLAQHQPALEHAALFLDNARALFLELADRDAAAYARVNELQRRPEGDPARADLPAALAEAVDIPMITLGACADLLSRLHGLASITNRHLRSDLAIAAVLAEAAARASKWNVAINASFLTDRAASHAVLAQADAILARASAAEVERACAVE